MHDINVVNLLEEPAGVNTGMEEVEVTMSPASSPQEDVEVDEGEDNTAEVQPDFTAQEVEVEEVTVTETEEVTEITEVIVTDETLRDQQDDCSNPVRMEDHSSSQLKDLDSRKGKAAENARPNFSPGKGFQNAISLESGMGIDPVDNESNLKGPNGGVHEDEPPGRKAGRFSRQLEHATDDEVMTEVHDVKVVSDVGEVVRGDSVDVNEMHGGKLLMENLNELSAVEADPQEESIEPGKGQGAIPEKNEEVADPSEIGGRQHNEAAVNQKHKLASSDGVVREVGSESPLVVGCETGALEIDSLPMEGEIQTGEINKGGSDSGPEPSLEAEALVQLPTSTENAVTKNRLGSVQPSAETELWSAPPSVAYFSDAQQAQLRSQILVLGDLRKGTKPDEALIESACPDNTKAGGASDLPSPLGSPHAVLVGNGDSNINSIPTVPPFPAPRSEIPRQPATPAMIGIPGDNDCGTLEMSDPPSDKGFPSTAEIIPQTDVASPTNLAHLPNRSMALEPNYKTWFQDASQVRVDTDKQLQQAQSSAQDAMATATAALAQSHVTWARIQSQNPSEIGNAREAQIASVAATVAAAASVAKAAVEAANAIADASSEAYMQAGGCQAGAAFQASIGGGVLPQLEFGNSLQPHGGRGSRSPLRGKNRKRTQAETHQRVDVLDSVVQAAGMAAQAATQAGNVLAMGNPLMQARNMEAFWSHRANQLETAEARVKSPGAKKGKTSKVKVVEETPTMIGTPTRPKPQVGALHATESLKKGTPAMPKRQVGASHATASLKKRTPTRLNPQSGASHATASLKERTPTRLNPQSGASHATASPKQRTPTRHKPQGGASHATASLKKANVASHKQKQISTPGREAAHGKSGGKGKSPIQQDSCTPRTTPKKAAPQVDLRELRSGTHTKDDLEAIGEGSVVEVMSEEVGLRGGWFAGKVVMVTEKEVLVIYDELLTEDEKSHLKEWFPLDHSVGEPSGSRRQVRPVHPYGFMKEAGSKKRRRVALGSQNWAVGDHVDAFIQDGWWEGVVKELNDVDESKVTVFFPGENDTVPVKTWDLRPSLKWQHGQWKPLTELSGVEDDNLEKRQKVGSSSGTAKKEKRKKKSLPEVSDEVVDASPLRTTRQSASPLRTTQQSTEAKKPELKNSSHKKGSTKGDSQTRHTKSKSRSHPKGGNAEKEQGTPKKLALGAERVVTQTKSGKEVETPKIRTPTTRGKSRAERQEKKRLRR